MPSTQASKVLLCLRYGIGDLVMELPAVSRLREVLPRAHITALAAPPALELLEGGAHVDRVISTQRWGVRHRWDAGDEERRGAIGRWVEEEGFDLLLDVGHAPTAVRRAVERRGLAWLDADQDEERRAVAEGASGVAAIARAVRKGWGVAVGDSETPTLPMRDADRAFAEGFLATLGLAGDAPVALSPVASSWLKRWPADRFARLADALVERGPTPVLLLPGPQREAGEAVLERMRRPSGVVVVGAHHLLRTAALLRRCRLLVCNDTGLMHLAAAVGTRTVAVFGPTSAALYRPPVGHARAVETGVPCRYRSVGSLFPPSCLNEDRCLIGTRGCVEAVEVQEVLAAVRDVDPGRGNGSCSPPYPDVNRSSWRLRHGETSAQPRARPG